MQFQHPNVNIPANINSTKSKKGPISLNINNIYISQFVGFISYNINTGSKFSMHWVNSSDVAVGARLPILSNLFAVSLKGTTALCIM